MIRMKQSFKTLGELQMPNGLFRAAKSKEYDYVWLRDCMYMIMPYCTRKCGTYQRVIWKFLDWLRFYEWKLNIHTKERPTYPHQYLHSRLDAKTLHELDEPWGHAQNDAIGALLFNIGQGVQAGKSIFRDSKDREIVQKLVHYLNTLEYWHDKDNGMWEENQEIHASSVGACIAGLHAVYGIVDVPNEMIDKGYKTLDWLLPRESLTKATDLALLSLIYPYTNLMIAEDVKKQIIENVMQNLSRARGVIRYTGDTYYATPDNDRSKPAEWYYGKEAEWTMGFPWLSLCCSEMGKTELATIFLYSTERHMLENAELPELYYANTAEPGVNTPLGWGSALYILAVEALAAKVI